ncbi:MAG: DUF5050 domain-containing protein [Clostridiales bacterium]|jgi:hypothetical protein|nr:DUF5050 domain-containing protein [Clostridiales bacterium]
MEPGEALKALVAERGKEILLNVRSVHSHLMDCRIESQYRTQIKLFLNTAGLRAIIQSLPRTPSRVEQRQAIIRAADDTGYPEDIVHRAAQWIFAALGLESDIYAPGGLSAPTNQIARPVQAVNTPAQTSMEATLADRGNSVGNIVNEGLVALRDGWIYYTSCYNNANANAYNSTVGLWKFRAGGSERKLIQSGEYRDVNVIGGWIYCIKVERKVKYDDIDVYHLLCKTRCDGSDFEVLDSGAAAYNYINVVGEWVYYSCHYNKYSKNDVSSGLYKIKTDGRYKTKISDDFGHFTNVVDEWIYYSKADDNFKLYRIRTDGYGRTKLSDDICGEINVNADWIYYSNGGGIFKIRLNGAERVKIIDARCSSINVADGWVYYRGDGCKLYKVRVDGSFRTKLTEHYIRRFNLAGDWVYYIIERNPDLYKIRTNGTDRILVHKFAI